MFIHHEVYYKTWLQYCLSYPIQKLISLRTNYVFISNFNRQQFLKYYPSSFTSVLYNPVENNSLPSIDRNLHLRTENSQLRSLEFLFLGISQRKNPLKALKICSFLASIFPKVNIKLHFYGHDPELLVNILKLESTFAMNQFPNFSASFHGFVDSNQLFSLHNSIPTFLLISSNAEGIPLSITEAMKYGIPTISNYVGGVSELVDSSVGYIYSDQIDLSQFVLKSLESSVYDLLSSNCQARYASLLNINSWSKALTDMLT